MSDAAPTPPGRHLPAVVGSVFAAPGLKVQRQPLLFVLVPIAPGSARPSLGLSRNIDRDPMGIGYPGGLEAPLPDRTTPGPAAAGPGGPAAPVRSWGLLRRILLEETPARS